MKPSNRLLYEYFEEYASERGNDTFLFDEKICYTVARAFNIAKSLARQLQNAGINAAISSQSRRRELLGRYCFFMPYSLSEALRFCAIRMKIQTTKFGLSTTGYPSGKRKPYSRLTNVT